MKSNAISFYITNISLFRKYSKAINFLRFADFESNYNLSNYFRKIHLLYSANVLYCINVKGKLFIKEVRKSIPHIIVK